MPASGSAASGGAEPSACNVAPSTTPLESETLPCTAPSSPWLGSAVFWWSSSSFAALLRGLCLVVDVRSLGGLCTCSFSWVFCAKLAVGLVILARNPSSGAFATLLVRDFGTSWPPGCDASDAREVFFASVAAVVEVGSLAANLLLCGITAFRALVAAAVSARLAGRSDTELAFATEAAVGAVAAAGRRAGLVGDHGRGLLLGEVGVLSFFTPLLGGTASEAFVFIGCVTFDAAVVAADLRSGLGKAGERITGFEVVFPGSPVLTAFGEETFFCTFGDVGVFWGGLLGVVGDFVETRGRTRPPGGRTEMAFLFAMKVPFGGGSFRTSFTLVANEADCEVDVGFATGLGFVDPPLRVTAPALAVSDGKDSNADPFKITPKPPSSAGGW